MRAANLILLGLTFVAGCSEQAAQPIVRKVVPMHHNLWVNGYVATPAFQPDQVDAIAAVALEGAARARAEGAKLPPTIEWLAVQLKAPSNSGSGDGKEAIILEAYFPYRKLMAADRSSIPQAILNLASKVDFQSTEARENAQAYCSTREDLAPHFCSLVTAGSPAT